MALQEFNLSGKVAIVTGAGRGIGKGIALALAEAGADIVAAARTQEQLEQTAAEVRHWGRKCLPLRTDVTRAEEVERMAERTLAEFGRVDILVNNAGTLVMKPLAPLVDFQTRLSQVVPGFDPPMSQEDWQRQMDTNLTSIFLCLRAVVPQMMKQRKGKIINISSMEAVKGFSYHSAYSASKGAISALTRSLALEWARYNINVNAIGPGYVPTALTEFGHQDEKLREQMLRSIPLRRFASVRDIGLLAVYLASAASDYITGQTIYIDGGVIL
jgi:NAD(P)-dependent dehydrogenase (short-subunit alcohol dehydrogenase family)